MQCLSPVKFYGSSVNELNININRIESIPKVHVDGSNRMPDHLLGPPKFRQEFSRQAEALKKAAKKSTEYETLCTFAYHNTNGFRRFIVAHPEVYWRNYHNMPSERRCSYEVIPEGAPCWIYLDLEYLIELNPSKNGPRMTGTLIDIICAYILKYWNIVCSRRNVINLDSTTNEKFSRHLIFAIENVAFKDNYHVGQLVKTICAEIIKYLDSDSTVNKHEILSNFDKTAIEELCVDAKNGKKLFIDTGVYTKNRQFRLYKSTKWGKNSHLEVASDSEYVPVNRYKDKELGFFIDSLISYFPKKKDLILLEFMNNEAVSTKFIKSQSRKQEANCTQEINGSSQYPRLDEYIRRIINPGKIRICKYNKIKNSLTYEILEYRYCENIKRWHKSNNIYLIVDLTTKVMYQKCHDEDCSNFISNPKKLPKEISFCLDDEDDAYFFSTTVAELASNECDFSNDNNMQPCDMSQSSNA